MATRVRTRSWFVLLMAGLFFAGCNTGSRSTNSGGTGPGPTPTPPPGTVQLNFTGNPLQASQASQRFSNSIVALSFTLEAVGGTVFFRGVTLDNMGTIDESTLGAVSLIEDQNGDGLVTAGEPTVGTGAAAAADNAQYMIAVTPAFTLMVGAPRSFLVAIDGSAVGAGAIAAIGQTINCQISATTAINADDGGTPPMAVNFSGTLPHSSTVTMFVNDHILISEVVNSPTANEYIELVNPTAAAIDLTNYHLTDFTDNNVFPGEAYFQLPTGNNFGPAATTAASHFHARFPAGTMINSGQVLIIAVDGADFNAATGMTADLCLRDAAGGTTQMLTWDGVMGFNFQPNGVHPNVGLANAGETVILYHWDGSVTPTVLPQDVDIVNYNDSPSALNFPVDKSGEMVTGVTGAYPTEQTIVFQSDPANRTPIGTALQRIDYSEGTETTTGGAGITGHDETSENFPMTFAAGTATPGAVP